jgi:predicted MPP superfamily phosphohydrolase
MDQPQATDFRRRNRLALWVSLAVNAYIVLADCLFARLHVRGWGQSLIGFADAVGALLSFPGFYIGLRAHLRDGHHTTTPVWLFMLAVNFLLWWIIARVALRLMFPKPAVEGGELEGTTRRQFLSTGSRLAVAAAAGTGVYSLFVASRWFGTTHRVHHLQGLPPELNGLRVVQLSDIHHGPNLCLGYVREIIAATNALNADIILLTGDYVHRSWKYIDPVVRELSELRAKIGILATLGNHDWWEGGPATKRAFAKYRIPLIDNDRMFLTPDRKLVRSSNRGLCIAGIGDYLEDEISFDMALGGVPDDMPRLLMSHNPDSAEDTRLLNGNWRIDLMLCGHTHGGQVKVPLLGTPIVPSRFGQKYAAGLIQGPRCPVFISRGVGMTVLPVRFRVPPEIAVTEFHSA